MYSSRCTPLAFFTQLEGVLECLFDVPENVSFTLCTPPENYIVSPVHCVGCPSLGRRNFSPAPRKVCLVTDIPPNSVF